MANGAYAAAAIQFEPTLGNKEQNLTRLTALVREAAGAGARLVVAPEMATTGYCFRDREEVLPLAEPVPDGPTVERLGLLAAELGIYLAVGLPELDPVTGALYNTAVLIEPHGWMLGKYRKTHLFWHDTYWAAAGDLGIPTFDTELGRLALLICMDLEYFETARLATLAGAEVILFPTNWLGHRGSWYSRALENHVYVVAADRWGEERGIRFAGDSAVIGPDGALLGRLDRGNGIVLAEVDPGYARAKAHPYAGDLLADRRPELYHGLLLHSHLWAPHIVHDLPAASRPVLAAAQFAPGRSQAENLSRIEDLARWADRRTRDRLDRPVDLVLFPEGALGPVAEPAAGSAAVERLTAVAAGLGCHLCLGIYEQAEGALFSAALLIGPTGVVGRYRKLHLATWEREAADTLPLVPIPGPLTPGDGGLPVFDLPWGRVGMLLGTDMYFPEAPRVLAKQGADLLLVPAVWPGRDDRVLWRDRWQNNDVLLAVCNQAGPAGGGSAIYGDHRDRTPPVMLDQADGAVGFLPLDLGPERTCRRKEMLRRLRPELYGALTAP